ncbi:MAG: DUF2147 domain-containing protein [Cyclobacteriaceae bacterium]|nr:DUF2147 domain-containing protein [Cyclobacteriaceae bacterium]
MIIKRYFFLLAILCSSLSMVAQAGDPNQIVGIWKSPSNEFMIKIDKLGNQFQGRIIWLESTGGQAELDENNPDERLQKIPLKGNKVIKELSFNVSESLWEGGTFYNHKEGKLYNCKITLHNNDQIKITKYVQNDSDGIVETWTRHY